MVKDFFSSSNYFYVLKVQNSLTARPKQIENQLRRQAYPKLLSAGVPPPTPILTVDEVDSFSGESTLRNVQYDLLNAISIRIFVRPALKARVSVESLHALIFNTAYSKISLTVQIHQLFTPTLPLPGQIFQTQEGCRHLELFAPIEHLIPKFPCQTWKTPLTPDSPGYETEESPPD
ncbi:hypothetical protein BDP27DRAFT_1365553 [Rhodocollybia butyracea]|uniref:Uncharacterized protein n=1 Tax=Rhodocollybia butyracea TaxID=206335 RepID=A0A9P5PQ89_9AGAR|nr:hypothetical protein BDP27DRAFT_1365553 [Rhodocollybia butyracea]